MRLTTLGPGARSRLSCSWHRAKFKSVCRRPGRSALTLLEFRTSSAIEPSPIRCAARLESHAGGAVSIGLVPRAGDAGHANIPQQRIGRPAAGFFRLPPLDRLPSLEISPAATMGQPRLLQRRLATLCFFVCAAYESTAGTLGGGGAPPPLRLSEPSGGSGARFWGRRLNPTRALSFSCGFGLDSRCAAVARSGHLRLATVRRFQLQCRCAVK